jgi:hypothetical protein
MMNRMLGANIVLPDRISIDIGRSRAESGNEIKFSSKGVIPALENAAIVEKNP